MSIDMNDPNQVNKRVHQLVEAQLAQLHSQGVSIPSGFRSKLEKQIRESIRMKL